MWLTPSQEFDRSPMVSSAKAAPFSPWHSASADAIFIGCWVNMSLACQSPVAVMASPEMSIVTTPRTTAGRYTVRAVASSPARTLRTIHQAAIPATNVPAVRNEAAMVCGKAASKVMLVSTAPMSVIWARPVSGSTIAPTGCCIQELAARMKYADRLLAMATAQMHARWMRRESLSQPKIHRPRNVDSMKNAASASMASGAPKTSPTNREYSLQFMPNWNSWTIPVATPMAKLMRRSLPKNLVSRSHFSSWVRTQNVCISATRGARPIVNGTKMKW